ncbi:MAG TPA: hypothetical protein VJY62_06060 [Bacteroidia bacterium]|nr:hypothetical protein [Bacteroidia bacterium]
MKKLFKSYFMVLLILLTVQNCFSQKHASDYFVRLKGSVNIIHVYQGGAEPGREILEEISKPVPFINTKLFLKKTYYGNLAYIIQTDSSGNFDLNIKPGVYNIYLSDENASSKKMIDSTDVKSICEEQYKTQSHGQLKVYRKGNSPVEITIRETINPCLPLPPAAEPKQN